MVLTSKLSFWIALLWKVFNNCFLIGCATASNFHSVAAIAICVGLLSGFWSKVDWIRLAYKHSSTTSHPTLVDSTDSKDILLDNKFLRLCEAGLIFLIFPRPNMNKLQILETSANIHQGCLFCVVFKGWTPSFCYVLHVTCPSSHPSSPSSNLSLTSPPQPSDFYFSSVTSTSILSPVCDPWQAQ